MSQDDKKFATDDATQDTEASADAPPLAEAGEDEAADGAAQAQEATGDEAGEAEDDIDGGGEAEDSTARLEAELDQTRDRLLRAMAETENLRRRAVRERDDAAKYAISGFARDLLTVVDNLRRALDSLTEELRGDDSLAGLISGVEITERELLSAFERHGIRPIDPRGEKFDHNFHQAMFHVESSDQPAGTIIEVVQVGYVIAGRLLRPAMVGVAKTANQAGKNTDIPTDTPHIDTKV